MNETAIETKIWLRRKKSAVWSVRFWALAQLYLLIAFSIGIGKLFGYSISIANVLFVSFQSTIMPYRMITMLALGVFYAVIWVKMLIHVIKDIRACTKIRHVEESERAEVVDGCNERFGLSFFQIIAYLFLCEAVYPFTPDLNALLLPGIGCLCLLLGSILHLFLEEEKPKISYILPFAARNILVMALLILLGKVFYQPWIENIFDGVHVLLSMYYNHSKTILYGICHYVALDILMALTFLLYLKMIKEFLYSVCNFKTEYVELEKWEKDLVSGNVVLLPCLKKITVLISVSLILRVVNDTFFVSNSPIFQMEPFKLIQYWFPVLRRDLLPALVICAVLWCLIYVHFPIVKQSNSDKKV